MRCAVFCRNVFWGRVAACVAFVAVALCGGAMSAARQPGRSYDFTDAYMWDDSEKADYYIYTPTGEEFTVIGLGSTVRENIKKKGYLDLRIGSTPEKMFYFPAYAQSLSKIVIVLKDDAAGMQYPQIPLKLRYNKDNKDLSFGVSYSMIDYHQGQGYVIDITPEYREKIDGNSFLFVSMDWEGVPKTLAITRMDVYFVEDDNQTPEQEVKYTIMSGSDVITPSVYDSYGENSGKNVFYNYYTVTATDGAERMVMTNERTTHGFKAAAMDDSGNAITADANDILAQFALLQTDADDSITPQYMALLTTAYSTFDAALSRDEAIDSWISSGSTHILGYDDFHPARSASDAARPTVTASPTSIHFDSDHELVYNTSSGAFECSCNSDVQSALPIVLAASLRSTDDPDSGFTTGITPVVTESVSADPSDRDVQWYTLQGQRLTAPPTVPGLYLRHTPTSTTLHRR